MNALGERIARLIAAQGPISVAQFMTLALHDPEHGYYATREPFGARGDFITAPEISQIFGEILGLWCAECWRQQGSPPKPVLAELGPGRGTLMADALRALRAVPDFLDQVEVVLIEASPRLRAVQAEALKPFSSTPKIRWVDRLDESLTHRPLFLLANEFFDALPVRQYVFRDGAWHERMLTLDDAGALSFAAAPFAQLGLAVPASRGRPEDGAVYEISHGSTALVEEIGHVLARHGGAALLVDYGYSGSGFGETLQALRGQGFAFVLEAPGEADLSSHVDFAALAEAARNGGAITFGPVAQNTLLARLGIQPRAAQLAAKNPADRRTLYESVLRLLDPAQMGTLFKALAILPPQAPPPPGF